MLQAEIPELDWPLRKDESPASNPWAVLDFLQFCFRAIGKPIEHDYHPFSATPTSRLTNNTVGRNSEIKSIEYSLETGFHLELKMTDASVG